MSSSRLTAPEVAYILEDSGAKALITSHGLRDVAAELVPETGNLMARFMVGGSIDGYDSWEEATAAQPSEPRASISMPTAKVSTPMSFEPNTQTL